MSVTIPLPSMAQKPNATAHLYPAQIGLQAEEMVQATVFFVILADTAAGQRVRQAGAIQEIENEWVANGIDLRAMNEGWTCLNKYHAFFQQYVIQNAPIAMRNHWDWYIRNLGRFVEFARTKCGGPTLGRDREKQLLRLGKKEMPLATQLQVLRDATGLALDFEAEIMEAAKEMSLVRNLGLHNRWEVDDVYLEQSSDRKDWRVGEVRVIQATELLPWRRALSQLLIGTWSPIARLYVNVPSYPV